MLLSALLIAGPVLCQHVSQPTPAPTVAAVGYAFGAPVLGATAYLTVPFACTVTGWDMTISSGTAAVDVWRAASGAAVPTAAGTITAAAMPAIATGTALHSQTLTGWATQINAGDILGFNVNAITGSPAFLSFSLECQR